MLSIQLTRVKPTLESSRFGAGEMVTVTVEGVSGGPSGPHLITYWSNGHVTSNEEIERLVGFEELRVAIEGFLSSGAESALLQSAAYGSWKAVPSEG